MAEEKICERTLEVQNYQGVHARPSAMIVKLADQYKSDLMVCRTDDDQEEVNGKSIMGIMMLAAAQGTQLVFRARGEDAEELLDALEDLFKSKFDEEE